MPTLLFDAGALAVPSVLFGHTADVCAGTQKMVAKQLGTPIAQPKTFANAEVVWKAYFTKDIQIWQVRAMQWRAACLRNCHLRAALRSPPGLLRACRYACCFARSSIRSPSSRT